MNLSLESTSFSGGRLVASNGGFAPRYFVTDHLGSVRMVVNESGSVLELNDYYPYGGRWETGDITDNRYRYNGKETQEFVCLPYTDFGARMYNPQFARSFNVDPFAEIAPSISPYAFCANNPINAIDLDGNLVIFINGFTLLKNEQGTKDYWRNSTVDFSDAVQSQLADYTAIYRHGGNSPLAATRMLNGAKQAHVDFNEIINLISDKNGLIKETIKIITHSMGAAYGKGYVAALKKLLKKNGYGKKVLITLAADFDPYQADDLVSDSQIKTQQFTHKGIVADQRQRNLSDDNYYEDTRKSSHFIISFFSDISRLQEGTYTWDGEQWILQTK